MTNGVVPCVVQKKGNGMSGSEMQREKERVAAMMREKQAAGKSARFLCPACSGLPIGIALLTRPRSCGQKGIRWIWRCQSRRCQEEIGLDTEQMRI